MKKPREPAWNRRLMLAGGGAAALGFGYFAFRRPAGTGFNLSKASPRVLHRGNAAEPTTLDPPKSTTSWEDWIIGDLMIGLMHHDAAGNPIPCACESYHASADGLTYTIRLREHNWSDGTPVTADDYVFSLRRIGEPKTASQYVPLLYFIKNMQAVAEGKASPEEVGVRAIDRHTLEIQALYQVPYMDQLLMHASMYAVPRHAVEKFGDDWAKPGNYVSNGAFILKEWVPNDHVRVVKNPHFYDAANVHFDEIYYYPTQDSAAALKRFRAGELDLCNRCPAYGEVPLLRKIIPNELRITPIVSNFWLAINCKRKPFTDLRVRQALAMALDRETLVNKVIRIGQTAAYTFMPPGMPSYPYSAYARFRDMPLEARKEKARALLAEAGFGADNPLTFDLAMYNSVEWRLVAITLQAMWREIGVEMKPAPADSQILYDLLRKKDFDVASAGWIADYRDPRNFLFLLLTSSADLNYSNYSNPRYDQLVTSSDFVHDPAERQKTMAEAEQILLDDVGVITLYNDTTRDLVSPQVQNWISNPTNFNRSRWLTLDREIVSV
jgi:oligopeptide transport system substrate-binding protein